MTAKKNQGATGTNESRRDFLKKTGLGIGTAAALPATFLAQVLEVKAAVQMDGSIINKAAAMVEANARKGAKGNALSLMDQYRGLGGSSKDVVQVLKLVDARLAKINAFQRYNKGAIDRAVQDSIIDYVGPKGGVAADKSSLYDIKGSAAREMFDRGGARLKSHLSRAGVQVPGFNASRSAPTMQYQRAPTMQHQQLTPGLTPETLEVNPGTVAPTMKR